MRKLLRIGLIALVILVLVGALAYGVYLLIQANRRDLAGTILTIAVTIVISTITLVVGRYLERKRELEVLHRDNKIPVYGDFLKGLFEAFSNSDRKKNKKTRDFVTFFEDWQREIVLWGGSDVVNSYIAWNKSLKGGNADAATVFQTEDLMLAIRRELGHNNVGIKKGSFISFILQDADLFFRETKKNHEITLEEMAKIEEEQKNV